MGNSFSWFWNIMGFKVKKKRVLMLGLEDSGKTTILYRLKLGKIVPTSPTNCFNLESFEGENGVMEIWDIAGRWSIRRHFYAHTEAMIFVIDLTNPQRIIEATQSLIHTMEQEEIRGLPVLILLNKKDALPSQNGEEIIAKFIESLNLHGIKEHCATSTKIQVEPCSAYSGEGLSSGIQWLWDNIK